MQAESGNGVFVYDIVTGDYSSDAQVVLPAGLGASLVGARIDLAALVGTAPPSATNAVGFDLLP